jgi:hypothetical protein
MRDHITERGGVAAHIYILIQVSGLSLSRDNGYPDVRILVCFLGLSTDILG